MAYMPKIDQDAQEIAARQRTETKDKLFIQWDETSGKCIIGGTIALAVRDTKKVIILEDEFKSSYDCTQCGGKGKNRFDQTCSYCNGKGAIIEVPDMAKARPTSGVIVVAGTKCKRAKVGDRVAYSGYTGHLIPFKNNTRLRIMMEKEFFCWLENVEGATPVGEKIEFVDKDTAYDLT